MFKKAKKIIVCILISLFLVIFSCLPVSADSWPIVFDSNNLSEFLTSTSHSGSGELRPNYEIISGSLPRSIITKPYLFSSNFVNDESIFGFFPKIFVNDGCCYKFRIPFRTVSRDEWFIPERLSVMFKDYNSDSLYSSDLKYIKETTSGVYTLRDFVFEGTLRADQFEDILYIDIEAYGSSGDLYLGIIPNESIVFQQSGSLDSQYIVDNQKEMYEKEKQDIDSSGNDSIDDVTEVIPSDNEGFVSALQQLSSCLVSSGTRAKWDFPRVYIPAIPNVFAEEVELIPSTVIDFNFWINKIPSVVLTIVRTVFTLALLIFCFKELYSLISYVMTLKKGE